MEHLGVAEIFQKDKKQFGIVWTNGVEQTFDVVKLRRMCPCASCVDEQTGKRQLDPNSISDDIIPISINSVGRYAINIHFTDGHKTGIYTFSYLRQLANN